MSKLISKEMGDGLRRRTARYREGAAVLYGVTIYRAVPEAKSNSLKYTTSEDILFGL